MNPCPACNRPMELHAVSDLMDCCMRQKKDTALDTPRGTCPNCREPIKDHSSKKLAKCTIAFLKSFHGKMT